MRSKHATARLLLLVTCALPAGAQLVGPQPDPPVPTAGAPGDLLAAILTPDGVALLDSAGKVRLIHRLTGARGLCFDATNEGLFVAGPSALVHMDLAGSVDRVLTDNWPMIDAPALAPDGLTLAFAGYTPTGRWAVYTLAGRNANPVRVAHGLHPAWLPDGRALLFENYTDESAQVYRHDPDTRAVTRIDYGNPQVRFATGIAVSADGARWAFAARDGLFLRETATGRAERLTRGFIDRGPRFTPDGGRLLFIRETRNERLGPQDARLMAIDLPSGQPHRLVPQRVTAVATPHVLRRDEDADPERRPVAGRAVPGE